MRVELAFEPVRREPYVKSLDEVGLTTSNRGFVKGREIRDWPGALEYSEVICQLPLTPLQCGSSCGDGGFGEAQAHLASEVGPSQAGRRLGKVRIEIQELISLSGRVSAERRLLAVKFSAPRRPKFEASRGG